MSTGLQLQELAQLRLEEAEILFFSGKYDGCVYLCGYVVELALKAIICKHLAVVDYPEGRTGFKVHKADDLKLFAGLSAEVSSLIGQRKLNWLLLTGWDSVFRYKPRNSYNQQEAAEWLEALRDQSEGVLPWLSTKW